MVPFFAGRAEALWAQLGSRTTDEDYSGILKGLSKPFIEYFKMFYADTVLSGSAAALRCGLDFFGPDHIGFASDCPFDPDGSVREQRFDTGIVHVNGATMAGEPSLPNGGVKDSGWGRSGHYSIEDFTEIRLTTLTHGSVKYPF